MPGCGKSTIGAVLSKKLGREMLDTDALIKEKAGKTPADIINESGEEALIVQVWYGPYCSEASEMVDEVTLPMTDEGLESSRSYLWEQYCLLQKKSMEENN